MASKYTVGAVRSEKTVLRVVHAISPEDAGQSLVVVVRAGSHVRV